jgi:hypothetical protein
MSLAPVGIAHAPGTHCKGALRSISRLPRILPPILLEMQPGDEIPIISQFARILNNRC